MQNIHLIKSYIDTYFFYYFSSIYVVYNKKMKIKNIKYKKFYDFIGYKIIFYLIKWFINFYLNEYICENIINFFRYYMIVDTIGNKIIFCYGSENLFNNIKKIKQFVNFNVIKSILE
ncbi:hypothetical protein M951_chr164 (nucleomorph) [Lotharella oceanica]|uniref:Uncharacterized protein n=1 Tax=Lotharella oceanica TaxID=641309 RepID=A0A060DAK7_9EUKA|nr:hypothetical protein M951_chr164 [Lotharella oceanica]